MNFRFIFALRISSVRDNLGHYV